MVYWKCRFRIQIYIFEILTPKIYFWANLSPKIQGCLFCLKIGTHSISRMLIPNPDLDFWKFHPKINFWENLRPKNQSCPFCLKIGAHNVWKIFYSPKSELDFWNFDTKTHFWASLGPKIQICRFCLKNGTQSISRMLIPNPRLIFESLTLKFIFRQIWMQKFKVLRFV